MGINESDFYHFIYSMETKGIDIEIISIVAGALRDIATDNGFDKEGFFDEFLGMLEK